MSDDESYSYKGAFLDVEIVCKVAGPQLSPDEKDALKRLADMAEATDHLLFAAQDPDEYQRMLEEDPPERSWDDLMRDAAPPRARVSVTDPGTGITQIMGPPTIGHTVAEVIPLHPGDGTGKDPVRFGRGLKVMREVKGLTRMQLKVLAGLGNHMYLAEIEGGHRYPTHQALLKLATAFGMGPTEFEQACLHPEPEKRED